MQPAFKTLNEALLAASVSVPDKGYIFLNKQGATKLSYKALYEQASQKAKQCNAIGIGANAKVILTLDKSPEFTVLYYALLLCGAVPCVLPTMKASQANKQKLEDIASQIQASHIISGQPTGMEVEGVRSIEIEALSVETSEEGFKDRANETALIQCSSGTTAKPKCLALSQSNVLANLEQMRLRLNVPTGGSDVMVSWLPLNHDMGLIGCFLASMYGQIDCVQMTAFQFLRKPETWLQAISDYKGTLSSVPNFAYALVTKKTSDAVIETLDLSSWRSAMCGAEQINFKTLDEFSQRFQVCGFNPNAITPCYGLAEAALSVSMHVPGAELNYETLLRTTLIKDQTAYLSKNTNDTGNSVMVMDCGKAMDGTDIQIRNEARTALKDGDIGEIWISGPSIIDGYIDLAEENATRFVDDWFNTGDLGYLREGHLFVTGRKKEVIIIRGHNYAPTEFEWVASEVLGVAFGKVIAFGIFDESAATELLHVVFEREKHVSVDVSDDELAKSVKLHVAKRTGILPHLVQVLPKNTISKTTSGKLQRLKIADMFALKELA